MSNHSSKASSGDLFIDYSRSFTVRRAKSRSKTKSSSRTKNAE